MRAAALLRTAVTLITHPAHRVHAPPGKSCARAARPQSVCHVTNQRLASRPQPNASGRRLHDRRRSGPPAHHQATIPNTAQDTPDFNEAAYLAAFPKVADSIRAGHFASGQEHYRRRGAAEKRLETARYRRALSEQSLLTRLASPAEPAPQPAPAPATLAPEPAAHHPRPPPLHRQRARYPPRGPGRPLRRHRLDRRQGHPAHRNRPPPAGRPNNRSPPP